MKGSGVTYKRVLLRDYLVFQGANELMLDRLRTIIVGKSSTGKTTIVQTLKHLGPIPTSEGFVFSRGCNGAVCVEVLGDKQLLGTFRSIIFLGDNLMGGAITGKRDDIVYARMLGSKAWNRVIERTRELYQDLVFGKHKGAAPYEALAAGERVCMNYARVLAIREAVNIDLPLVIDGPYDTLDATLRKSISDYLKKLTDQQILLSSPSGLTNIEAPQYRLERFGNGSIVKEA